MARKLKDTQLRTLRFIYDYIKSKDYAPKRKEIAEALGISLNSVQYQIHLLFDYGYLRESYPSEWGRGIALTAKGISASESDYEPR